MKLNCNSQLVIVMNIGTRAQELKILIKTEFYEMLVKTGIPIKLAIYRLRRESRQCESLEDYVDLAFSFNDRFPFRKLNIKPLQVKEEILGLLNILKERSPKVVLEIGTAKGGTLFLLSRVAAPNAKIISVDLPDGPFGGGYPEWRMPLYRSFARDDQEIHLIRADSHSPETVQQVERILEGREIDFIFIDGDHTYEGVREDFETYSPFTKKSGIVAFHDIVENPNDVNWQVHRFWDEIKHKFEHTEIVSAIKEFDRICGIGILHMGIHGVHIV